LTVKELINKPLIKILELIYSLIFAVGITILVEDPRIAMDFDTAYYFFLIFLFLLILIRFFFAPSKIIGVLLEHWLSENKSTKRGVDIKKFIFLLIDVPVMFSHAIIFVFMCRYATKETNYFLAFNSLSFLLFLNAVWLLVVFLRVHKKTDSETIKNSKHWMINNGMASVLMFGGLFFKFSVEAWGIHLQLEILYIIALLNSVIDFIKWRPSTAMVP